MNAVARLEFELTYYDSAVDRFNHYTTRTHPNGVVSSKWVRALVILLGNLLDKYPWERCELYFTSRSGQNKSTIILQQGWQHPTQIYTDADYAVAIALLANTPAQAKSLLQILEKAAGGVGLRVNVDETENLCFIKIKQETSPLQQVAPWNLWTNSPALEAASHLGKITSIRD